jgi:cyclopropane fatty-acyl-phospholipid synthase-like methyltransferase
MAGWVPYPRYIFRKEIALSLIRRYVPKGSRFLEIGCASGDMGISLAKLGYEGKMIDFSEEAANEALRSLQKEQLGSVRFENRDFMDLDDAEPFDLVTMFEVLEHIEEDKRAVEKARGLLKDGGVFLLSVPARKRLWGASDVIAGHFRRYDRIDVVRLMAESGFEIVRLISYGFPWINIAKRVRDRLAMRALAQSATVDKAVLTRKSGLTIESLKSPRLECLFNRRLLLPLIKISCLFNAADLADGYLCLALKVN